MESFDKIYQQLNPEQKDAVDSIEGPVFVLAGPGTGKTQVLTTRIANILKKTDVDASSILALTFTDAGVTAMKERLATIIGKDAYYVNISTFHGFSAEIIQEYSNHFAQLTTYNPLSDLEKFNIFKEIFDELDLYHLKPFGDNYYYIKTASSKIQDLKREGITPDEFLEIINKDTTLDEKSKLKNSELQKIYVKYQSKLNDNKRYDFDDMINNVLNKMQNDKDLLATLQEKFQYTLVDEFQDTNSSQAELIYKINGFWGENANIFVVGDDDQSIYRFQGASTENIYDFKKRYPLAKQISLIQNYRSTQPILDASKSLIENNTSRVSEKFTIDKQLKSQIRLEAAEKVIEFTSFDSSHFENFYIAKKVQELLNLNVEPKEIAILCRNNNDLLDISDMLDRFDIEYTSKKADDLLQVPIVKKLLKIIRTIHHLRHSTEDLDLFTVLNYDFLDLNTVSILKIIRFASKNKSNILEAIYNKKIEQENLTGFKKILNFFDLLTTLSSNEANMTFFDFVEETIYKTGYINYILKQPNNYELLNSLNSFLSEVKRMQYSDKEMSLEKFIKYLDIIESNNITLQKEKLELTENKVNILTAHGAKGLEFKHVFIAKFNDKKWSNSSPRNLIKLPLSILDTTVQDKLDDKQRQLEEERRLFFVAITRAKENIYLTSSKQYSISQIKKDTLPSMFLYELPDSLINKQSQQDLSITKDDVLNKLLTKKKEKEDYIQEEKAFLEEELKNFKLSASSLNTYLECHYKFKLDQILRTPELKDKHLALGTAVHKMLESVFLKIKNNEKIDLDYILKEFENALKLEVLHKNEYEETYNLGKEIITEYYKTYKNEFTEQPKESILYLEKWLGSGFSKPLLKDIPLRGKIDKVEIIDKANKTVKIVDYKTGAPKSRNAILGKTKYSKGNEYRQLLFYKLLLDLDKTINYKVKVAELDFIGNRNNKPKRESFEPQEHEIDKLKEEIRNVYKNIKNLNFEKTTDYSICHTCRYKDHCWPEGIPITSEEQLSLLK